MRGGKGGEQKSQLCEAHTYRNTEDHTDAEAYTKHRNTHTKADRQKHRGTHIHRSTHTAHTHSAHTHRNTHTYTTVRNAHTGKETHTACHRALRAHTHAQARKHTQRM